MTLYLVPECIINKSIDWSSCFVVLIVRILFIENIYWRSMIITIKK